ncbi:MAG TPA: M14 family metallopeptidase [Vicinamibacterales bacterium]|nr:M14 family metallopeptidase [Vicinamibacterales bacterium]
MTRRVLLLAVAVAAVSLPLRPAVRVIADTPHPQTLTTLVAANSLTRDSNGDGLADVVAARVIVPANPSLADLETATNLAARLGYETTALTLPLVIRDSDVAQAGASASTGIPILVGRDNRFVKRLAEARTIDLASLKPGQGLVAAVPSPLGPGTGGTSSGIVVVGGDDDGTLNAGIELAARLPRAWGMSGIALPAIGDQAVRYLRAHGITASEPGITSMLVDSDKRGVARIALRVDVAESDGARAVRALEDLELAHRRGQEPKTLNFTNIATTAIDLMSGAKLVGHANVSRTGLNQRTLTPPIDPDELAPDSPGDRGAPAAGGGGTAAARNFDLTNALTIDGWYGDAYADLIPDRTDAVIVLGTAADAFGATHIAARLGLETTGITLPLTRAADKIRTPEREPSPILVGGSNALVQRLVKIGKARIDDLQPGEGAVEIVPRAFGNATATVVAGPDPAGTEAASMYVARRLPYVWDNTRGSLSLSEVSTQVNRFLQARSAAGQASQIDAELDTILAEVKDKTLDSFDVKLYVERADPALEKYVTDKAQRAGVSAPVKVSSVGVTDPVTVFDETMQVPWEVDDFRAKFKANVLPRVKAGSKVDLELRVSESPEVRRGLADDVRAQLVQAGATDPRVRVLSAYKQGYLWMTEQVIPELKGKGAKAVHVKVAEYRPDLTKKYKFYMVPSRWVHELYPVDEIFLRDLAIAKDNLSVELVSDPKDIYTVEATDAAGKVVYRGAFSPKTVEREYLDRFPGWSRVLVTTGWLSASVDGTTVADERIATDPERFWDYYQSKVLPRIFDNVMKVTDNRPLPDKQPFHRDLDIEVWMSEPDFKIGVDEELISSLEAIHEDLYFVTLDFFDALGRTTTRRRLAAPGKIFPIIHPERAGQPGEVKIHYAGNASTRARIEVAFKEKSVERPTRVSRDLTKIDTTPALVHRVVARRDRLSEIALQVEAKDDREAVRAADALDALARLHAAGLYRDAFSFDHVDRVAVIIGLKDAHSRRVLKSTGAFPPSNVRSASAAQSFRAAPGKPMVTWDHIISPDESETIVGQLAAFQQVKAYNAGTSYRGRDISVLEITNPTPSELVSLPKLSAYKPTIFITGRQHANEVSSTSHILRLAELLVTDKNYKDILKKVNVVLHPVENPDGAQMAYDLQKLTPTHMLHAGRYSALGMDVASQVGLADPLLPESLVRTRVWRDWLPDIYLNPHGYPSHEWVQPFAGYVPPGFRTYLSTRGWYTSIGTLRDPRYPNHGEATEALREAIVREINANADVRAMDLRHQARYRKWAYGFGPYVFNQEIYKDTAIYYSDPETGEPSGSRRVGAGRGGPSTGSGQAGAGEFGSGAGAGRFSMNAWPQVTFFSGGTEAPDETAQGEWLNLVAKAGFSYVMANVRYLRDGQYTVQRIEEDATRDSVSLTTLRIRPVMPGKTPASPGRPTTTTSMPGPGTGGK